MLSSSKAKTRQLPIYISTLFLLRVEDYDTIWGLDPGMRDMFVGTDNEGNVQRCSSSEFYNDAKFIYSNAKTSVWRDSNPVIMTIERNIPLIYYCDQLIIINI